MHIRIHVLLLPILLLVQLGMGFAQTTVVGPGIGGQVHAVTFDPENEDVIYAGGDTCGAYRYSIALGAWEPWSEGLAQAGMNGSYYVDDLLVVRDSSSLPDGVYAATHGGIFYRGFDDSQWDLCTSGTTYQDCGFADNKAFGNTDGTHSVVLNIPFSTLALDQSSGVVYAGAGHGRSTRVYSYFDDYYPAGGCDGYSLWALSWSGTTWQMYPVPDTNHGQVRKVIFSTLGGGRDVFYASEFGIFQYNTVSGTSSNLWPNISRSNFDEWTQSKDPWSVGIGKGGVLYGLMSRKDENLRAGVYTYDLNGGPSADWESFATSDFDFINNYPDHNNLPAILWRDYIEDSNRDLTEMSVVPGDENSSDQIFIGERKTGSTYGRAGYFRHGDFNDSAETGWLHIHRSEMENIGGIWQSTGKVVLTNWNSNPFTESIYGSEVTGWVAGFYPDLMALTEFTVHPENPDIMVGIDYHIPLLTTDGGASWENLYCTGNQSEGWKTKGLNIMGARTMAFYPDGRAILGAADFGVFVEVNPNSDSFNLLDYGSWTNATESWPTASVLKVVERDSGFHKLFVVDDQSPGNQVLTYDHEIPEIGWSLISSGLETEFSENYTIYDMEIFSATNILVSTWGKPEGGRIFEGVWSEDSGWEWSLWFQEGGIGNSANPNQIKTMEKIPGTTKLLLGMKRKNLVGFTGSGGSVTCIDYGTNPMTATKWVEGSGQDEFRVFEDISAIAVDPTGEYVYVGSSGHDTAWTLARGGVFRFKGPFDGPGIPTPEILTVAGTDPFGLGAVVYPPVSSVPQEDHLVRVRSIVIDPSNPEIVYIALNYWNYFAEAFGAWRYHGGAWSRVDENLDGIDAGASILGIHPSRPSQLWIGTLGQEFFRTTIPVSPAPIVTNGTLEYYCEIENEVQKSFAVISCDVESASTSDIAEVRIDVSALEDIGWVDLTETDGRWSATVELNHDPEVGEFSFPVIARDMEWNTLYEPVGLMAFPHFANKSAETNLLSDTGGTPWAATTLNVGDLLLAEGGWNDFGNEDVIITVQGDNPAKLVGYEYLIPVGEVPRFTDITVDMFHSHLPGNNHHGIAVADLDNDHYEDIILSHFDRNELRIYCWNNALGKFEDAISSDRLIFDDPLPDHTYSVATGDYNQDGYVDLLFGLYDEDIFDVQHNMDNPATTVLGCRLYTAKPIGSVVHFQLVSSEVLDFTAAGAAPFSISWIDVNGDSALDIFLSGYPVGSSTLMINSGAPLYRYSNQSCSWFDPCFDRPYNVWSSSFADLNNDGLPELIVGRSMSESQLEIYENTGASFSLINGIPDLGSVTNVSTGDMDLNGLPDIITIPQDAGGKPHVLLNFWDEGGPRFLVTEGGANMEARSRDGLMVHDWGMDGDLDLFLGHTPDESGVENDFFYLNESEDDPNISNGIGGSKAFRVCVAGGGVGGGGAKITIGDGVQLPKRTVYTRTSDGRGGQTSRIAVIAVPELPAGQNSVTCVVTWPDGIDTEETLSLGILNELYRDPPTLLVQEGSVEGRRTVGPDTSELEFECLTSKPMENFRVHFLDQVNPCLCGNTMVFTAGDPGVETEITCISKGLFKQKLILTEWCCVAGCDYTFIMQGEYKNTSWTSGVTTFSTGACGKKLPNLQD